MVEKKGNNCYLDYLLVLKSDELQYMIKNNKKSRLKSGNTRGTYFALKYFSSTSLEIVVILSIHWIGILNTSYLHDQDKLLCWYL